MEPKIKKDSRIKGKSLGMVVCLCLWTAAQAQGEILTSPQDALQIRIAVFKDLEGFQLSLNSRYKILAIPTGETLSEGRGIKDSRVKASSNAIMIGDQKYPVDRLHIVPQYDTTLSVNNRRFRGTIQVIKNANNRLLVVNVVGLEDYVRGVLYHEISQHWPRDALKAQSVATRTYALKRWQEMKTQDFDVTSDIYSQVYGGRSAERYRINQAVRGTRGQVLLYQGKILPAYFHATCAGATEDANELWKEDLAPLKGGVCGFCIKSPHYLWKKNLRLKDIQDKLNAHGHTLGLIKEIKVLERNKSGRIRRLEITTREGQTIIVSGKEFREILGPNLIKSNNYVILMKGYYVDFIGRGWGHGVGMCQWGVYEMARQRYRYDEILKFYYPGSEMVRIGKVNP